MSHPNQDEITYEGMQQFLRRVGFEQPVKIDCSLAFHHQETGTIVMLSIPEDGRLVRPADLLSIVTRLETLGLVGDSELEQIKTGKLPMAS